MYVRENTQKIFSLECFVAENKWIRSEIKNCKMIGKTIVYFVTKIRIVFKPAIFSANIFLKSIFFLINQIAKRGQKLPFPKQTNKPSKMAKINDRFSCQKTIINRVTGRREGKNITT